MILSPEATEAEAEETVKRISELISEGGGSVSKQENWGIRRLAYPIQRFIEGNYFITRCHMEAQAASQLDKTLNSAQDVLRHLIFKLEKSEIAAMEAQAERERQARERQEAEARAAAEREAARAEAAERDRQLAEAQAAAQAQAQQEAPAPVAAPPAAETPAPAPEAPQAPQEAATETPVAAVAEEETTETAPTQ